MSERGLLDFSYGGIKRARAGADAVDRLLGPGAVKAPRGLAELDDAQHVYQAIEDEEEIRRFAQSVPTLTEALGPAAGAVAGGVALVEGVKHARQIKNFVTAAPHEIHQKINAVGHAIKQDIISIESKMFHRNSLKRMLPGGDAPAKQTQGKQRASVKLRKANTTVKRPLPGGGHVVVPVKRPKVVSVGGTAYTMKDGHIVPANNPNQYDVLRPVHISAEVADKVKQKLGYVFDAPPGFYDTHAITSIGYVEPRDRFAWSTGGRAHTYGLYGKARKAALRKYKKKKSAPRHPGGRRYSKYAKTKYRPKYRKKKYHKK